MIHPSQRRWVRVIGTDKVFQMTLAFIKRLGVNMVEVTYDQAMQLRQRQDNNNKLKAQQNQLEGIESALLAANRPGGPLPQAAVAALSPGQIAPPKAPPAPVAQAGAPAPPSPTAAAIAAQAAQQPESAEAALLRVTQAGGDDDGIMMTDGLDTMSRTELFNTITMEALPVKKMGTSAALVTSIRNAREDKAAASVDPGTDIPVAPAPVAEAPAPAEPVVAPAPEAPAEPVVE